MKLQSHFSQLEKTRIIKNTDLISYLLSLPRYLSLNIFKELEATRASVLHHSRDRCIYLKKTSGSTRLK